MSAPNFFTVLQTAMSSPADFDFVIGRWNVAHRRLKERLVDCDEWVAFPGTCETRKVMDGAGNVEDNWLDFPGEPYRAVALRSFNAAVGEWAIWWLDGRDPWNLDVPVKGGFAAGTGLFYAETVVGGVPVRVRFTWIRSPVDTPRWEQAFSNDAGITWETNWTMDFSRRS